jgi:hypothetical protein
MIIQSKKATAVPIIPKNEIAWTLHRVPAEIGTLAPADTEVDAAECVEDDVVVVEVIDTVELFELPQYFSQNF